MLQRPAAGLVGLKWRETRQLFGKAASVDKWITAATEEQFYATRAESDGFIFLSTLRIEAGGDGVVLRSIHDSQPQTLGAKIMALPMGLFFKGVARRRCWPTCTISGRLRNRLPHPVNAEVVTGAAVSNRRPHSRAYSCLPKNSKVLPCACTAARIW